jgi:hypothetical protein
MGCATPVCANVVDKVIYSHSEFNSSTLRGSSRALTGAITAPVLGSICEPEWTASVPNRCSGVDGTVAEEIVIVYKEFELDDNIRIVIYLLLLQQIRVPTIGNKKDTEHNTGLTGV